MKSFHLLALLLLLSLTALPVSAQREVEFSELVQLNGKMSVKGETKPFSGFAVMKWPNGKIKQRVKFVQGMGNGPSAAYHENGRKWMEFTLKNNNRHGWAKEWDDTGKLVSRKLYRDGDEVKPSK